MQGGGSLSDSAIPWLAEVTLNYLGVEEKDEAVVEFLGKVEEEVIHGEGVVGLVVKEEIASSFGLLAFWSNGWRMGTGFQV